MTGDAVSPLPTHVSCRNRGRHRRILSRVARPSPSPSAHGAARARAVRPRAAPPGRARGQGPAPIAHHCYCTRFAASAGAGGGDGGERGTVGTDGTDGTDGADGAGGTTNCSRCADGLRRGLGSFTIGKPALRPWPAAVACHVQCRCYSRFRSKRIIFFVFLEKYGPRTLPSRVKSTLHPAIFWEMVKFVDLGVLYFALVLATEPTMGSLRPCVD